MKSRNISRQGFTYNNTWCAFRDTGIYTIMLIAVGAVKTLLIENRFIKVTANDIEITATVFLVVFAANSIACAFGMTTLTSNFKDHNSGYYSMHVPATMVIASTVGLITFVVLLLMGKVT